MAAYYIKTLAFYLKGRKSFTKEGFERVSSNFSPLEKLDLKGWSFMVTGGSSGIGRAVVEYLAKREKTTVHIVCSNPERGEKALQEIKAQAHDSSSVALHLVDLSDPKEVFKFTRSFVTEGKRLNVLIHNAGILTSELELTSGGLDRSFSLNVVGTYLLIDGLAAHMAAEAEDVCRPRIIVVSSGGMLTQDLTSSDPSHIAEPYDGVSAYAQHKRQQIVITDVFSDIYPRIHFSSMHPGWVDTPGVEKSLPNFYKHFKDDLRTPAQGADTILWLATSHDALKIPTAQFFFDRAVASRFIFSSAGRYPNSRERAYWTKLEEVIHRSLE